MSTQPVTFLTPDEYLEIEEKNDFRSEFVHGEMFAMAEPSANHEWIVSDTLARINEKLRGRPCGARAGHTRVFVARYEAFTYPDIVVTCGPDQVYQHKFGHAITDATAIVEVLSPSAKDYNRGEKFRIYRGLPSLADYLILAQDEMRAEHHARQPDGAWLLREFSGPADTIELKSIGCRLELQSLYERVRFEAAASGE